MVASSAPGTALGSTWKTVACWTARRPSRSRASRPEFETARSRLARRSASRAAPRSRKPGSQRLQILHQITLLLGAERQALEAVVVVDYVLERGEATIVVEAALPVR